MNSESVDSADGERFSRDERKECARRAKEMLVIAGCMRSESAVRRRETKSIWGPVHHFRIRSDMLNRALTVFSGYRARMEVPLEKCLSQVVWPR